MNKLPPPYEQIEYKNTGEVQGKMINVNKNLKISIQHRLQKAKQIWGRKRKNIPQSNTTTKNANNAMECADKINPHLCTTHARIHGIRNQKSRSIPTKMSATNTQ